MIRDEGSTTDFLTAEVVDAADAAHVAMLMMHFLYRVFSECGVIAPKTGGGVFQISMERALGSRPLPSGHLYNIPLLSLHIPTCTSSIPHQY